MLKIVCVKGKWSLWRLLVSILISEGTGLLSALLSMGNMENYKVLEKPFFAPPSWVFAPVWTLLFLLMGLASYRIWMYGLEEEKVRDALFYYGAQLVFNFMWTILFFRFELRGLALLDLLILLVLIVITTVKFYRMDKTAGYLMIPYILWVTYAGLLNLSIWWLNR